MAPDQASLVVELQRATHAVGLRLERRLARTGLSQGDVHVLALLADGGPHTVGELQRHVLHRPSTLTGLLDRLEQRGWVRRSVNRDDRRSYLVSITPSGQAAARSAVRAIAEVERGVTQRASARDVAGFLAVARALSEHGGASTDEFSTRARSDLANAKNPRSARHGTS